MNVLTLFVLTILWKFSRYECFKSVILTTFILDLIIINHWRLSAFQSVHVCIKKDQYIYVSLLKYIEPGVEWCDSVTGLGPHFKSSLYIVYLWGWILGLRSYGYTSGVDHEGLWRWEKEETPSELSTHTEWTTICHLDYLSNLTE